MPCKTLPTMFEKKKYKNHRARTLREEDAIKAGTVNSLWDAAVIETGIRVERDRDIGDTQSYSMVRLPVQEPGTG